MNGRRTRLPRTAFLFLAAVFVVVVWKYWNIRRSAENQSAGRSIREWVELALAEDGTATNFDMVLKIGSPTLPFLIVGLNDQNHNFLMQRIEWLRWHLPELLRWKEPDSCVMRHLNALNLLWRMGEKAQPAVPAIIRCFETCPNLHYVSQLDCLNTLAEIGHAASNAVPFLTQLSRSDNSYSVRAAATEYYITDRPNLFAETILRRAKSNPEETISARELYWFRDDHELNRVFVPMFAQLLFDRRLSDEGREAIISELRARGNDSVPAIPFLLARSTASSKLRSEVMAALPGILAPISKEEEQQFLPTTASERTPEWNPVASEAPNTP